jgi:hypothetical protein
MIMYFPIVFFQLLMSLYYGVQSAQTIATLGISIFPGLTYLVRLGYPGLAFGMSIVSLFASMITLLLFGIMFGLFNVFHIHESMRSLNSFQFCKCFIVGLSISAAWCFVQLFSGTIDKRYPSLKKYTEFMNNYYSLSCLIPWTCILL